jgi:uncharacterized protein (DUF1501 family)
MQRRQFIRAIGLAGSGLIPIGQSAWAALAPQPSSQRKLIVVLLRGAVDGLNVVIPYQDPNYYRLRPAIAIPRPGQPDGAMDLDGYFGLHPALAPLLPFWGAKKLAFVHATGSPDPTRSHFDAQDFMESGTPGRKATPDGWMNRLAGTLTGPATPTRAISVGPVMPRILNGPVPVTNMASGAAAGRPTVLDRPVVAEAFSRLYNGQDALSIAYQDGQVSRKEIMSSLEEEMRSADNGAPLPNGFPDDANRLATLMRRDPRIQLAFLALGGWDTHANEGTGKGQLAGRLAPLGQGLAILAQKLGPSLDDTAIVVMSEFGRTVRQNGNNGTDHGHGNVMWVLGGHVAGGKVHGEWPGLNEGALYEGRDLAVTTDFRTILANIVARHLALTDAQLSRVFPQMPEPKAPLSLYRA